MNKLIGSLRKVFLDRVAWRVVEVERPRPLHQLDPEAQKSVVALAAHPGFLYLMAKLRLQRHAMEEQLRSARHSSMRDVEFLQSGIHWCDWLHSQLQRATMEYDRPSQPATPPETEAFEEIRRMTEMVGANDGPGATSSVS